MVDEVIRRGLADPERLGIAGWSHGQPFIKPRFICILIRVQMQEDRLQRGALRRPRIASRQQSLAPVYPIGKEW